MAIIQRPKRPQAQPLDLERPRTSPGFGTDGIRGRANQELTPMLAMDLGRAVALQLAGGSGRIVVAQDTRRSGDMLTAAVVAGATSMGFDVACMGVAPTAALAFAAARWPYDGGIMVSASHNPAEDNGLKVLTGEGTKLDPVRERAIEELMRRSGSMCGPGNHGIGIRLDGATELTRYVEHRTGIAARTASRARVVIDGANGSASAVAAGILRATGATVIETHVTPDGSNINDACGATHPAGLAAAVQAHRADVGFAFDGDADRCVVVDERGRIVDGDALLGMLALDRLDRGQLPGRTLVITAVSNGGLEATVSAAGGRVVRTPVGDRSVWDGMAATGSTLGGEKSGHVIVREHATTGDGIVTALEVLDLIARRGASVSSLAAATTLWPQCERVVPVMDRTAVSVDPAVRAAIREAELVLHGDGRVLVRPSGTEPVVRIMVEGQNADRVAIAADDLERIVRRRHAAD